jgi:hypothetical protein
MNNHDLLARIIISQMQPTLTIQEIPCYCKQLQGSIHSKNDPLQQPLQQPIKQQLNSKPYCGCYNKETSHDMRCCGLCYGLCNTNNKDDQCYFCPETFEIYYKSGYFVTNDGLSRTGEPCEDWFCTIICLPTKIPIFFPCLLGSLLNNFINYCRDTNDNYLF